MVERFPMSKTGHLKLKEELTNLERVERHVVVKAIEIAREHGDLKENAEYHAAKERQGMIEGRIRDLKDKLGRAEVIDCAQVDCARAVFGTVVELLDMDTDEEVSYQLLGSEEADVIITLTVPFRLFSLCQAGRSLIIALYISTAILRLIATIIALPSKAFCLFSK